MDESQILEGFKDKLEACLEAFQKDLSGVRTGRASAEFLEPVMVSCYGSMMPLAQVASINVQGPRLLTVQVWDSGLVVSVEKALREASLGVNPQVEGQLLRLPLPDMTQERRQELIKMVAKYAEQARVAMRNVRRHVMDEIKGYEKTTSEDDRKRVSGHVEKCMNDYVAKIDKALQVKESDLKTV